MAGIGSQQKAFEDQFEAQGTGYLYRHNPLAAPIAVSSNERERFVADFKRRMRYIFWGTIGGMPLLAFLAIPILEDLPARNLSETAIQAGVFAFAGIVFAVVLYLHRWAWKQPMLALRERRAAGDGRSREEVNRKRFSQVNYGTVAFASLVFVGILVLKMDFQADLFAGMNLVWLIMGAAFVAFMLYAIIQKIRYGNK